MLNSVGMKSPPSPVGPPPLIRLDWELNTGIPGIPMNGGTQHDRREKRERAGRRESER